MNLEFVLALLMQPVHVSDELDVATLKRMKQRELFLQEKMAQLLQETEQQKLEQSEMDMWALLFTALQSWQCWALAGMLVLLFVFFWMLRKRRRRRYIRCPLSIRRRKEEEEEEEDEEPNDISFKSRTFMEFLIWPVKSRQAMCKMVQELVDELLCVCQIVPKSYFMPRLHLSVGVGIGFEDNILHEDNVVYRLLVPLKPPPGHAFHLEPLSEEKAGVRISRLFVQLQCTCAREQLVGDILCFLHHPSDKLRRKQMPSLLRTLCTGSHLDMQKTARWFQDLVTEAWIAMPQSSTVKLEVLPSCRFCKLRLTTASSKVLHIELMLGVQQDDSDTFLTFE